jgi:1,2-phenylacetyl-CoA epoxidase PaaB subunit
MGGISVKTAAKSAAKRGSEAPRRAALTDSRVWQVYARQKYDEPLHEVGTIVADDEELAKVYARSIYDEFPWIEMMIVPRTSVVTVIAS